MEESDPPSKSETLEDVVNRKIANKAVATQILRIATVIYDRIQLLVQFEGHLQNLFYAYLVDKIFVLLEEWNDSGKVEGLALPFDLDFGPIQWKTKMTMRTGNLDGAIQGSSRDETRTDIMRFSFQTGSTEGDSLRVTTNGIQNMLHQGQPHVAPPSAPPKRAGRGTDMRASLAADRCRQKLAENLRNKLFSNHTEPEPPTPPEKSNENEAGSSKSSNHPKKKHNKKGKKKK